MTNFQPLEVFCRLIETELQMGEMYIYKFALYHVHGLIYIALLLYSNNVIIRGCGTSKFCVSKLFQL